MEEAFMTQFQFGLAPVSLQKGGWKQEDPKEVPHQMINELALTKKLHKHRFFAFKVISIVY